MNKRKVIFDMALNIVAAAIPTFVLQLLILPNLAKFMSDDNYGLLVTVLAFLNASSIALWAFRYSAFSSNSLPFFDGMLMYFLTAGPL